MDQQQQQQQMHQQQQQQQHEKGQTVAEDGGLWRTNIDTSWSKKKMMMSVTSTTTYLVLMICFCIGNLLFVVIDDQFDSQSLPFASLTGEMKSMLVVNDIASTTSVLDHHQNQYQHKRRLDTETSGFHSTSITVHKRAHPPDAAKAQFFEYLPGTYDFIIQYSLVNNTMEALVKKDKNDPTIYVLPCPDYDKTRLYCYDQFGHYNFTLDIWEIPTPEDVVEETEPKFLYTRVDGKVYIVNDPNVSFFDDIDNDISTDTIQNITQSAGDEIKDNYDIQTNFVEPDDTAEEALINQTQQQQEQQQQLEPTRERSSVFIYCMSGIVLTLVIGLIIYYIRRTQMHRARYRRQVLDDLHNEGMIRISSNGTNGSNYTSKGSSVMKTSTFDMDHTIMNNRGMYYSNNAKRFSDEPTEIDAADLRDVELH